MPTRNQKRVVQPVSKSRLFIGVFPAGLSYADTGREEHGDYKRIAFLSYDTLEFTVSDPKSPLLEMARENAAAIQARKGEYFQVSTFGQTVLLGRRIL